MTKFKVGDKIVAIFPNGRREHGIILRNDLDRLVLNGHALDGGFPEGTLFETEEDCAYLDWEEEEEGDCE